MRYYVILLSIIFGFSAHATVSRTLYADQIKSPDEARTFTFPNTSDLLLGQTAPTIINPSVSGGVFVNSILNNLSASGGSLLSATLTNTSILNANIVSSAIINTSSSGGVFTNPVVNNISASGGILVNPILSFATINSSVISGGVISNAIISGSTIVGQVPIALAFKQESLTGLVNNLNLVFTTTSIPVTSASTFVYINGLLQDNGTDYSLSGSTITFATAPVSGQTLRVIYPIY